MTSSSGVELVGADRLAATMSRAADDLEHMPDAMTDAGRVVQLRAASNAPKVSGALAASIRAEATDEEVVIGSDLVYAGVQEYGWAGHNISAQPYLRPALEDSNNEVAALFRRDADKALSQVQGA